MSVFFYGCITLDGFYQGMDVAIMGRQTFEEIAQLEDAASFYPTTENYVFTHAGSLPQKGFIPVSGDVAEFVAGLGSGKNIWVVGGNTILTPLLERDMVDHLIIQIAPVLLGEGVPLFTQKEGQMRFRLDEVKRYGQFAELIYSRR